MDRDTVEDGAAHDAVAPEDHLALLKRLPHRLGILLVRQRTDVCKAGHPALVEQHEYGVLRAAVADGIRGDRVEHRLNVRGRPGDRAEDLGGGSLSLERLLGLIEQAHILDRDHRLVREALDERDLLPAERASVGAPQRDHADRALALEEWDRQQRAKFPKLLRIQIGVRRVCEYIRDVDRAPLDIGPSRR